MDDKASDYLLIALENIKQVKNDLEACTEALYGAGGGDLCDLASDRIERIGRELQREIEFIEKLAEGAKILEERI